MSQCHAENSIIAINIKQYSFIASTYFKLKAIAIVSFQKLYSRLFNTLSYFFSLPLKSYQLIFEMKRIESGERKRESECKELKLKREAMK